MKPSRTPVLLFVVLSAAIAADQPTDAVRSRIKREPVTSSNVASVGYSHRLRALEIEFTRGAIYRFLDVPPAVYQGLMSAQSKGHFIAEYIRDKYSFIRVRPSRTPASPSRIANEPPPTRSPAP